MEFSLLPNYYKKTGAEQGQKQGNVLQINWP